MRAKTKGGEFYQFDVCDIPLCLNNTEFILVNKENSPIMLINTIYIGDRDSGLFAGDIVEKDNIRYLISYERGFYGISENYNRCYLNNFSGCRVVANYDTDGFPITLQKRKHIRFKYKDTIFTLRDIIGAHEDKLLLRVCKEEAPTKDCQQEVGIYHNRHRVYLGDKLPDGMVVLHNGRICTKNILSYRDLDGKESNVK